MTGMANPSNTVIGLLHPGEMGAAVGRCLTGAGHTVLWASYGRGKETIVRAEAAGLTDAGTPRQLAAEACTGTLTHSHRAPRGRSRR